jgi:hypothetical protein
MAQCDDTTKKVRKAPDSADTTSLVQESGDYSTYVGLRGQVGRIELRRFINVLPGLIGDSPSIARLRLSSNFNGS